jgi:hypothetical protein
MEAGACFSIWLKNPLTTQEKSLLEEYQLNLHQYNMGYSFMYEFKEPYITKFEKDQLLKTIRFVPREEIYICGLATPLFRSMEAILKYFGGFAQLGPGDDPQVKGVCHLVRKNRTYFPGLKYNAYYLIDWEIVANAYNQSDPPEIREIYSLQNFILHNTNFNL